MIVCLRTVAVPPDDRERYLRWIAEGRAVREAHGILAEWVLRPPSGDDEFTVVTVWPSHEVSTHGSPRPSATRSPTPTCIALSTTAPSVASTWLAATPQPN